MPGMSPAPSTPQNDEAHEAEVAKQAEIAAEVDATAASEKTIVEPAPTPAAAPEQPYVTLKPKEDADLDFPIAVSVVGSDDLIFTGPDDTVEVKPPVAEQITYSPAVEVAS